MYFAIIISLQKLRNIYSKNDTGPEHITSTETPRARERKVAKGAPTKADIMRSKPSAAAVKAKPPIITVIFFKSL